MKILLATDGSEGADKARSFVQELCRGMKEAEVVILYVVKPFDQRYITVETGGPHLQRLMEEMETAARDRARELLAGLEESFREIGTKTSTLTGVGEPAAEIITTAKEISADLVVLGSRGLGRIQGLLIGSVSDRVMHLAHCPVLIVR